ncbi:MAG: hypothetical protein HRK26_05405 [Rickettsiaceae bacterium H1]|nr:hypothetical protein [Rickettsiaceae bacterium H1]
MLRSIVFGTAISCFLSGNLLFANSRFDVVYHLGNHHVLYEGRTFLPLLNSKESSIFADIRAVHQPHVSTEFNLGIAGRTYIPVQDIVFGGYYFYDRRTEVNVFTQNTLGMELLGSIFEARLNFYMPFDSKYNSVNIRKTSDMRATLNKSKIAAAEGYDFEFGFKFPVCDKALWFYWGGNEFTGEGITQKAKKVRAEFDFMNTLPNQINVNIGLEHIYSGSDETRNSTAVTFRLGIPFRKTKEIANQDYRITKPIVRDIDIVTITKNEEDNEYADISVIGNEDTQYSHVAYVKTEEELRKALEQQIQSGEKQIIVLTDNIYAIRPITIGANRKVVSNTDLKFSGSNGHSMKVDNHGDYKLFYAGEGDIWQGVVNAEPSQPTTVVHNGAQYDKVLFADNEDELISQAQQDNSLVILTNGFTTSRSLTIGAGTKILGAGTIQVKNNGNFEKKVIDNDITIVDGSGNPYRNYIASNTENNKFVGVTFDSYTTGEKALRKTEMLETTKASQSDLTTLRDKVNHAETGLDSKASQSALTTLRDKVNHADDGLDSKASQSALTTLRDKVNHADDGLDSKASQSALTTLRDKVHHADNGLDSKASQSALTTLRDKINHAETGLDSKASQSALTTLRDKVNHADDGLDSKASQSALTTLRDKVNRVETGLDSKVDQNDLGSLQNSLNELRMKVTTLAGEGRG